MEEFEKYERIDRYLNGHLQGNELKDFTDQLTADPAFALEVELQKAANTVILNSGLLQLKKRIGEDIDNIEQERKARTRKRMRYRIFTGLLVVIVSSILLYLPKVNNEKREVKKEAQPVLQDSLKTKAVSPDVNERMTPEASVRAEKKLMKEFEREKEAQENNEGKSLPGELVTVQPAGDISAAGKPDEKAVEKGVSESQKPGIATCQGVMISADFITQASCAGKNAGSIEIAETSISGGKPPYVFSLNKRENETKKIFNYLGAGTYRIRITDANGCYSELTATVPLKDCSEKRKFSFNPGRESLTFSLSEEGEGIIRIMGRSGKIDFTSSVRNEFEWRGTSSSGSDLPSGVYGYSIEYANGKAEQGYITIIR